MLEFYGYRGAKFSRKPMAHSSTKGKLIAVIGDEDTCVGFLLGGVGELNRARRPNFMVRGER